MDRLKRVIIFCLLFAVAGAGLFAQTGTNVIEDPIRFSNARLSALGGYHAALGDDIMTIFNNPAGFNVIGSELLLTELTIGLTGPIFTLTSAMLSPGSGGGGPSGILVNPNMISLLTSGFYTAIDLVGPLAFAYAGKGLAFGFFNWMDVVLESKGTINLGASLRENILITGGYSFRIPMNDMALDIGLQLKAIFRGSVEFSYSVLDIFSAMRSDPTGLLMNNPFVFSMGGGADLGLLYSIREIVAIGLVARNIYTPTMRNVYGTLTSFLGGGNSTAESGLIPFDLSGGVKITPPLGVLSRVLSGLKILIDYNDILDFLIYPGTARHWLLHLGAGLELNLLEILSIRLGLAQGLFSAGMGLDLTIFRLNASMFGSELSQYPGLRPAYNLVLGLEFAL